EEWSSEQWPGVPSRAPSSQISDGIGPQVRRRCSPCPSESNLSCDQVFDLTDAGFVAAVKSPFLDPFTANEAGLRGNAKVLAGGGLAYAQFGGDQDAAHTVLY